MGVLTDELCELVPNRGFVEDYLCKHAPVLGKTGNRRCWLVEDGGSLAEPLCPLVEPLCPLVEALRKLVEAMNLVVPGRGQARAGTVRARRVALPHRTGEGRTPPSPLPSSPVHLRRIHRVCTSLQRS